MSKDNGGSAFPSKFSLGADGYGNEAFGIEQGMSLRDWFAGQALTSIIGNSQLLDDIEKLNPTAKMVATVAHHSYALADAMLEERSKP
jgi:hypothetical protein